MMEGTWVLRGKSITIKYRGGKIALDAECIQFYLFRTTSPSAKETYHRAIIWYYK